MARFQGTVRGSHGDVSRLGTKSSGLSVSAASWAGAVRVDLYVDSDGTDCARVRLAKHHGAGAEKLLYDGPVGEYAPRKDYELIAVR